MILTSFLNSLQTRHYSLPAEGALRIASCQDDYANSFVFTHSAHNREI